MSTEAQPTKILPPAATVLAFVAAGVVLVGVAVLPIGYYSFERWAVCAVAVAVFVMTLRANAGAWGVLLLPAAVLWNPIVPVYMTRSAWLPLDLVLAAGLLALGFWARSRSAVERS